MGFRQHGRRERRRLQSVASYAVFAAFVVFALATSVSANALAEDLDPVTRATARALGDEAYGLYLAKDYPAALQRFERAHALAKRPTTALWVARCLARMGRLVEAEGRYAEAGRLPAPVDGSGVHQRAQADAAAEREALAHRIPHLTVLVRNGSPGDAEVTLDGRPLAPALVGVAISVDPGTHLVRATRDGRSVEQEVTLREAGEITVTLDLPSAKAPSQQVKPQSVAESTTKEIHVTSRSLPGIIVTSVGGVILAGGILAGVLAFAKHEELAPHCPGGSCPPAFHEDVDTLGVYRTLGTVGIAAGTVLATAGVFLLLTHSDSKTKTITRRGWSEAVVVF